MQRKPDLPAPPAPQCPALLMGQFLPEVAYAMHHCAGLQM